MLMRRMCKWGHKVWHEILSMRYCTWEIEKVLVIVCDKRLLKIQDCRIIKLSSFVEFSTPRGFLHVKLCLSHLWFIVNLLVHISEFVMLWIIECYSLLKLSLSLSKTYMVSELFSFILKTYMVSKLFQFI